MSYEALNNLREFRYRDEDEVWSSNTIPPRLKESKVVARKKRKRDEGQDSKRCNKGQLDSGILELLSGKKRKVNEILDNIEMIEAEKPFVDKEVISGSYGDSKMVYSKDEWFNLLKIIKINFPKLSNRSKVTLTMINQIYEENYQSQAQMSASSSLGSLLWSMASSLPETKLTEEDLRWLYDVRDTEGLGDVSISLEENEMAGNLFTLSQIVGAKEIEKNEKDGEVRSSEMDLHDNGGYKTPDRETVVEVPLSSPRLSPLKLESKVQVKGTISFKESSRLASFKDDSNPSELIKSSTMSEFDLEIPKNENRRKYDVLDEIMNLGFDEDDEEPAFSMKFEERIIPHQSSGQLTSQELYNYSDDYSTAKEDMKKYSISKYRIRGYIEKLDKVGDIETNVRHEKREVEPEEVLDSEDDGEADISVIEIKRELKGFTEENSVANEEENEEEIQVPLSITDVESENDTQLSTLKELPEELEPFLKLKAVEMRLLLKQWDVQTKATKVEMAKIILSISRFCESNLYEDLIKISKQEMQTVLYNNISQYIKRNLKIYQQVLHYEPLDLNEINRYLRQNKLLLDNDYIKNWCEQQSITYTNRK